MLISKNYEDQDHRYRQVSSLSIMLEFQKRADEHLGLHPDP